MTARRDPPVGWRDRAVATAPTPDRPTEIRALIDGSFLWGVAVDFRPWGIDLAEAVAAIRGCSGSCAIACSPPGSLFDAVGVVEPSIDLSLRRVLATVARRRGHRAAGAVELRDVRAELATISTTNCDHAAERRQVAAAGSDEAELAERVATLRGELQTRRNAGMDVEATEQRLSDAVAALTEARTERLSAEQALDQVRETNRARRDKRDRRLRLQDRERNLEREIRRELADAIYDEFAAAVRTLPGDTSPGQSVDEYDGDDVTAALAVLRLLRTATPAVLAVDRFDTPEGAAHELGLPIVRV